MLKIAFLSVWINSSYNFSTFTFQFVHHLFRKPIIFSKNNLLSYVMLNKSIRFKYMYVIKKILNSCKLSNKIIITYKFINLNKF